MIKDVILHKGLLLPCAMADGSFDGMNLKIDKAGRLVLPKSVRSQLGITAETELELVQRADGVLLRRVAERPSMQEVDGLWVHQGTSPAHADWAGVIDGVRDERADSAWKT
jgi:AbrB family looped-hinge helix DNA binding protein